uniref:Putative ATPase domain containing protein n=1 Tax=viral metagenome TaxID=1070528 RepID=A0A6H1ZQ06_9ZZZZ
MTQSTEQITGFPRAFLFIGRPGTGKTWFLRTVVQAALDDGWDLTKGNPVYVFACDPGESGGQLTNAGIKGIDFDAYHEPGYTMRKKPYRQWSATKAKVNEFYDIIDSGKPFPYYAVAMDSVTGLQEIAMSEVLSDQRGPGGAYAGGITGSGAKLSVAPTRDEWGKEIMLFLATLSGIIDLPCYTLFMAHQKERTDPSGEKILEFIPAIYGRSAPEMSGSKFDEIMTFTVEGSGLQRRFVACTRPDLMHMRRSRSNLFPATVAQDFALWRKMWKDKQTG